MQSRKPNMLIADQMRQDPRIEQAKRLLQEVVADYSSQVAQLSPSLQTLEESHGTLLARLGKARGGAPAFPYIASGLGCGPWVELTDGSVKLDFIGGIGVHGLGHSAPEMLDSAIDSALEDTVMQGNLQQHRPSLQFCEQLLEMANACGAEMEHCLLTTSGAMANENALKLALHHRHPADRVIAFENAFAGRSLAMAALTDRAKYREKLPVTVPVDYLPFLDPSDPEGSTERTLLKLKELLNRYPNRYAAFWAEPVAGEGGYYPGSHEFFSTLCPLLREANIPIIFDEVQTFGRLSQPFAFQHFRLDTWADIVTVGKITQVCATLYGERFRPTAPILSQTFTGSSSSIACGIKVLQMMNERSCFGPEGSNMRNHQKFLRLFEKLADEFPGLVSGPYGCGMMIAWTPGDGSPEFAKRVVDTLYADGLIGFICGNHPTRIRFLPPPIALKDEHIDAAEMIMRHTFTRLTEEPFPTEK